MTPNDTIVHEDAPPSPWRAIRNFALATLGVILAVFAAGLAVGYATVASEDGWTKPLVSAAVLGGAALLAALGVWLARRGAVRLSGRNDVLAPRTRRARAMLWVSMGVGAVIGLALVVGNADRDPISLIAGPLPPIVAALAIAIWLVVVPILSWRWWQNVDEVEAESYKVGALWGIYAYSFIAPSWWIGWRGGFLPEPQEMITFAIVMLVWGIGWMRGRF